MPASLESGKREWGCGTLCHRDGSGVGTGLGVVTSPCTNTWAVALFRLAQTA